MIQSPRRRHGKNWEKGQPHTMTAVVQITRFADAEEALLKRSIVFYNDGIRLKGPYRAVVTSGTSVKLYKEGTGILPETVTIPLEEVKTNGIFIYPD